MCGTETEELWTELRIQPIVQLWDLPMCPSGLSNRAPCAVERDALSSRGSNISLDASTKELFLIIPTHMMEIIPGTKKRVQRCPL